MYLIPCFSNLMSVPSIVKEESRRRGCEPRGLGRFPGSILLVVGLLVVETHRLVLEGRSTFGSVPSSFTTGRPVLMYGLYLLFDPRTRESKGSTYWERH